VIDYKQLQISMRKEIRQDIYTVINRRQQINKNKNKKVNKMKRSEFIRIVNNIIVKKTKEISIVL